MSSTPTNSTTGQPSRSFVSQVLTVVGLVVLAVLVLAAIWYAADVFLVIFAGVLLGIFLFSLSQLINRFLPIGYGWCLALVMILIFGGFVAFLIYLVPPIVDRVSQLSQQLADAQQQIQRQIQQTPWGQQLLRYLPSLQQVGNLLPAAGRMLQSTFGVIVNVIVIFFVGLYTAAAPGLYRDGIIKLVPPARRDRASQVLSRLRVTLWRWVLGRLFSMAVIGVTSAIGLAILGIPLPITMGVIAGLLTFIPNIGPVLSVIPPLLLALSQGPMMGLYVILLYLTLQLVESYLLTPWVQQHQVALPPPLIISVQMLMGVLAGLLGVTLATPLAAAVLVLVRDLYVHDLLDDHEE